MKIKLNDVQVEGDVEDLKSLIFGKSTEKTPEKVVVLVSDPTPNKQIKQEYPPAPIKLCLYCKKPLTEKKAGAKYCGRACLQNYRYHKYRPESSKYKTCTICGKTFKPTGRNQKVCTDESCKKKQQAVFSKTYLDKHPEKKLLNAKNMKELKERKSSAPKKLDKQRERGLWITSRAKSIVKNQGISYEQAFLRAVGDWRVHNKEEPVNYNKKEAPKKVEKVVEDFPKFNFVAEDSLPILNSMFQHMIGTKGRLSYFDLQRNILLVGIEWSGVNWHNFVAETLIRSKDILLYFGAKGSIVREVDTKGYESIVYKGDGL